ncbi:Protein transport protein Sec61 alpha [Mycena kentingensis (nom. inval.)]|nr:Protein transport protein Sec61 alpha [Mycena kentingensis (nom. inval.)]
MPRLPKISLSSAHHERLSVLNLVRPFLPILPEVSSPDRKVPFNQKILWTAVTLLIFLVCSQVPLYGIMSSDSSDPLYWMRLLASANLIDVDFGLNDDRALFGGAQKLFALIIALGQGIVYVLTGLYGQPSELGAGVCLLLIQLRRRSHDCHPPRRAPPEGLRSRLRHLSFHRDQHLRGHRLEGVLPDHPQHRSRPRIRRRHRRALPPPLHLERQGTRCCEAFWRHRLPNVMNLVATAVIFGAVIYLQGFRIEIPVKSNRFRGQRGTHPIKLFYTSTMPIMLESALTSNVFMPLADPMEDSQQLVATSGIAYYMSPPHTMKEVLVDPIHTDIYIIFMLSACALFSKTWIKVSGSGPRDAARQLKDQQMDMVGHREGSIYTELKRAIPTAAALGGAMPGLLSTVADLTDWEIGMRESGGAEMVAFGDFLTGPTACVQGAECRKLNDFFFQCVPSSIASTVGTPVGTTTPASSPTSAPVLGAVVNLDLRPRVIASVSNDLEQWRRLRPVQCINISPQWAAAYNKASASVARMSLADKVTLATGVGWENGHCVGNIPAIALIGFPGLCLEDSPAGVRGTDFKSLFPAAINVAAAFNRTLMNQRGAAMGAEFRGKGGTRTTGTDALSFFTVLQLHRLNSILGTLCARQLPVVTGKDLAGDPYLSGEGAFQASVAKHYLNNEQEHFREMSSSIVDDRTVRAFSCVYLISS